MTKFSTFTDYKEFPIITKKNKKAKIKLFSSYMLLNNRKYEYRDISQWIRTTENIFIFILFGNKVKYFITENGRIGEQIENEFKKSCIHMANDKILLR